MIVKTMPFGIRRFTGQMPAIAATVIDGIGRTEANNRIQVPPVSVS